MKILCAADFHDNDGKITRFAELAMRMLPDAVVLAGDFASRKKLDALLSSIADAGAGADIMLAKGNMDLFDFDGLPSHAHDLSKGDFEMNRWRFCTLSHPCCNMHDSESTGGDDTIGKRTVIVSHYPPHGILDNAFWEHIGSTDGRRAVEKIRPAYYVCGHSHENRGTEKCGSTTVVNCSIGKNGIGTVIDLENEPPRSKLRGIW